MQNPTESSCEDNHLLSGGETSDDCNLASEDNTGSIQLLDTEEDQMYIKCVYADREESEETENHPLNSESDKHLKEPQIESKLDRIENALSKLSEILTRKEAEKPTLNSDPEKQSETQEHENKRLDVLEDALCKLTETVKSVAKLQYDIGQDIRALTKKTISVKARDDVAEVLCLKKE